MLGLRTNDVKHPTVAARVAGTTLARAIGFQREPKISLLTDFHLEDPGVYGIRSAIAFVNPRVRVDDITHEVPPYNLLIGASRLERAVTYRTEPEGTIYVAVVDPGVGTERKCLVVRTKQGKYLVGPDNGLLSLAFQAEGIDRAVSIENRDLTLLQFADSETFAGKDIFGPAAAHLGRGVPIEEFGSVLQPDQLTILRLECEVAEDRRTGFIVDIDGYRAGYRNLRTNLPNHLPNEWVGRQIPFAISAPDLQVKAAAHLVRKFGDCALGEPELVLSSSGALDLAVNAGHAADRFGVTPGHLWSLDEQRPTARIELDLSRAA